MPNRDGFISDLPPRGLDTPRGSGGMHRLAYNVTCRAEPSPIAWRWHRAWPDATLSVRDLEPDRLGLYEDNKGLLAWLRLNANGEPLQFGSDTSAAGTTFGPLATHAGGARYPRWDTDSSGSWRDEVHDAEFSTRAMVMPALPLATSVR